MVKDSAANSENKQHKGRIHTGTFLKGFGALCLCIILFFGVTKGPKVVRMAKLYIEAQRGDAMSQYELAECYILGRGLLQDYKKAYYWCRKAAEQGLGTAQFSLAYNHYLTGMGIHRDFDHALKWFTEVAKQGDIEAQNKLGNMYYRCGQTF